MLGIRYPEDFTFADVLNTAYNTTYGYTLNNIKGLIKVISPSGVVVYINSGYAAGNFASPDIVGATSTWSKNLGSLPLDDDGNVETGTYTFYYKVSVDGSTVWNSSENSKSYDLDLYTAPTIEIDMSVACRTSELTSTDSTDYGITIDNTLIEPSITRAHKIVKPEGAACTIPATASTDEETRTIGGGGTAATDIYTGVWQTYLTSTVVYDLDTWGSDVWIQINDSLTGYDYVDVECADCLCDIRQCIQNLYDKWITAEGNESRNRTDELKKKNLKVAMNFIQYEAAERCGDDSSEFCDAIADILVSEDCTCGASDDTIPTRVVAWGSSTGSGSTPATASAWLNGVTDPGAGLGSNGDYYLQLGTGSTGVKGDIWYKSGGAWTYLGNLKGDDGSAATGYYSLLENTISDSALGSTTSRTALKSYTLAGGTLTQSGDFIKITAIWSLGLNDNPKTVSIDFGGDTILSYDLETEVESANSYIIAEVWIEYSAASAQLVRYQVSRSGFNMTAPKVMVLADSEANASDQDIEVYGQCDVAATGNITCKQLKVEYFKLITAP